MNLGSDKAAVAPPISAGIEENRRTNMGKKDADRARQLVRKRIEVALDAWSYCDE